MTLVAAVTTRIPNSRLVQLTNQGDRSASTVDSTILAAAAADAEAEFYQLVGVLFDSTVPAHLTSGVWGCLYYLESYAAGETAATESLRKRWQMGCTRLAKSLGADRPLIPQTLSPLEYDEDATTRRPDNDRQAWGDVILDVDYGRDPRSNRG